MCISKAKKESEAKYRAKKFAQTKLRLSLPKSYKYNSERTREENDRNISIQIYPSPGKFQGPENKRSYTAVAQFLSIGPTVWARPRPKISQKSRENWLAQHDLMTVLSDF